MSPGNLTMLLYHFLGTVKLVIGHGTVGFQLYDELLESSILVADEKEALLIQHRMEHLCTVVVNRVSQLPGQDVELDVLEVKPDMTCTYIF